MNQWSKAIKQISSKRKKTEADYEEMARLEFYGGLYLGDDGPIIPSDCVEAALQAAARKFKEGPQARPGMVVENHASLIYDGPRTADEMWEDGQFTFQKLVTVNRAKILRTRPIFNNWSTQITVVVEDSIVSPKRVDDWVATAGSIIGFLEWRPRYGRFSVEKLS